jgi:hypothetical protein
LPVTACSSWQASQALAAIHPDGQAWIAERICLDNLAIISTDRATVWLAGGDCSA